MRRLHNHLHYERHYIADATRPIIKTSIITNNVGAVRSHFERVITVADAFPQREVREAIAAENILKRKELSSMQSEDMNIKVDAVHR